MDLLNNYICPLELCLVSDSCGGNGGGGEGNDHVKVNAAEMQPMYLHVI